MAEPLGRELMSADDFRALTSAVGEPPNRYCFRFV
jgi:hypothetical protein